MLKPIENGINKFANSNLVKKHIGKCVENPSFLTKTLLATSVSKDVFAYALRVNNTLKNKEVPEDKKAYIVKMDAVTGLTTLVVQMGTGLTLSSKKVQGAICSKLFSHLDKNSKQFKAASAGFGTISTLIGATLLAKRIAVPLISSAITDKLQNNKKV